MTGAPVPFAAAAQSLAEQGGGPSGRRRQDARRVLLLAQSLSGIAERAARPLPVSAGRCFAAAPAFGELSSQHRHRIGRAASPKLAWGYSRRTRPCDQFAPNRFASTAAAAAYGRASCARWSLLRLRQFISHGWLGSRNSRPYTAAASRPLKRHDPLVARAQLRTAARRVVQSGARADQTKSAGRRRVVRKQSATIGTDRAATAEARRSNCSGEAIGAPNDTAWTVVHQLPGAAF
jgi:hypothetical protein